MAITLFGAQRTTRGTPQAIAAQGGIGKLLAQTGRLPGVELLITPIDRSARVPIDKFLSYRFQQSILVPVDSFDFAFVAPDDPQPFDARVKDGDFAQVVAAGTPLSTGIIDVTEVETEMSFGENVAVSGRNILSQLEDQDARTLDDKPIYGNSMTVTQVIQQLTQNTRIFKFELQDAPKNGYLFATEPGESKLAALDRYLDPLNCLAWMGPSGHLIVGRPNMAQAPRSSLYLLKSERRSNVTSMKVIRSSTTIPNIVSPVWSGQENQDLTTLPPNQSIQNRAAGPNRLRQNGHYVIKSVVVSTPQGNSAQELSDVNRIGVAGSSNLLYAHAKREIARHNIKEIQVQVVVPGHYNELGEPYLIDTVYHIKYDRGNVDENMYLYEVDYSLDEKGGQTTRLFFCRMGCIVSDVRAR